MRVILFCFLCLCFTACAPSKYLVIDKKDFEKKAAESGRKKLILLDQSYFTREIDLGRIINALNGNTYQTGTLQTELQGNEKIFASAIGLLLQSNFQGAHNLLNQLDKNDFDYQVALLEMDCKLEMKTPFDVWKDYQSLLDSAEDRRIKNIVRERYRFYLYGL